MASLSYVGFHVVFVVPVLLVLGVVAASRRGDSRQVVRTIPFVAIVALALAYTTPWDNYLISRGVWWYGDGAVAGRLWLAPIEEYLFILLQPVVVALWLAVVSVAFGWPSDPGPMTVADRSLGVLAGLSVGTAGLAMLLYRPTYYMGAILAWAGPVLALQWAVGWSYLLSRWRLLAVATLVPATYFSAADRIAIDAGIWRISSDLTTGLTVGGLPIEEGAFFLVTTLFVVQGLVLYPWVIERWR
jgi:lycopene cyclase domain-containing protein